jgi:lipopolysaccharide cholinephosphotransferase
MSEQLLKNQDAILEGIWKVEQDILDEIDRVCTENGLRYSLAYGTLLGAVRHHGFIPWDDDIDIMMPREDYEKLIRIWPAAAREGYILQDDTMHDDYVNNYAKVRRDHTTFLQFEFERSCSYHIGIFVDIFPGDRVAPTKITRALQYFAFAVNLLYNRGYTSGTGGLFGLAERILLRLVPRKYHRRLSLAAGKMSRRWNDNDSGQIVFANRLGCSKLYYPCDLFEHLDRKEFQGKCYSTFQDADRMLRIEFGDYMQLPPEEERVWRHHPIIVDFERNYEEIVKEEENGRDAS